MNENRISPILPGFENIVKPFRFPAQPHEFKVVALRECPTPDDLVVCDTPDIIISFSLSQEHTNNPTLDDCEHRSNREESNAWKAMQGSGKSAHEACVPK